MCSALSGNLCLQQNQQTNNFQLQLTGYSIDNSCYNYSFHIQLCYIFSLFSQKFFSIFSMVPESKKFFPSLGDVSLKIFVNVCSSWVLSCLSFSNVVFCFGGAICRFVNGRCHPQRSMPSCSHRFVGGNHARI